MLIIVECKYVLYTLPNSYTLSVDNFIIPVDNFIINSILVFGYTLEYMVAVVSNSYTLSTIN